MTRKDYELIAAAMRKVGGHLTSSNEDYAAGKRDIHARASAELATALEATNPRFDRERFLKACGVA